MTVIFTILIMLCALLLILVVLIQNSKGGGLASNIGVSNQIMGVKKTTDVVEKATWYLIGILVILCIASGFVFKPASSRTQSTGVGEEIITNLEVPQNPNAPQIPGGQ
ncbi:MAG: preprotein translocase subunit SecG [Flavobacteriales bacterium]|nr:preprotein translocase subunit SecG [Flavobacteriales bacterium]